MDGFERGVVDELNQVRKNPAGYAFQLEDLEPRYEGLNLKLADHSYLTTTEGVRAVKEAVRKLQHTPPRAPMRWDPCLSASAAEHVADTGPKGLIGHNSSEGEGFNERIIRYIKYRQAGENISYGTTTAPETVQQLLIDDGVPDRGHRRNILDPGFTSVGVSCGPHAKFSTMCVIDFARE